MATWLLAHLAGGNAAKNAGEPWLRDNITLLAFRVFDEDVRVEIARREAEVSWVDKSAAVAAAGLTPAPGVASATRSAGGLRSTVTTQAAFDLESAWQRGDLVFIQPDVTRALHSGKSLSLRHGCMAVEWSDYLAGMHALCGSAAAEFVDKQFLPNLLSVVGAREQVFLDACSASGCLLRGSVLALTEAGIALRRSLYGLYREACKQRGIDSVGRTLPKLSICMDMTGEWTFSEHQHARLGNQRIAFSLAVPQVTAGVCRDTHLERMMLAHDGRQGLKSIGGVHIEQVSGYEGQKVPMLYNAGFAMTASAMKELTTALSGKAAMRELRPGLRDIAGVLDGYRLPLAGLELLVIQRYETQEQPWVLMKAGRACLAGLDVELFELLDEAVPATEFIIEHGMVCWV